MKATFPNKTVRAKIQRAARLLREGKLVAFPTETVYGLGANALDTNAIERVYKVKGRPPTSPLIVHAYSIEMAEALAKVWPAEAKALGQRFWPGPLTLVLPKAHYLPAIVTAGLDTVGIRVPRHPLALELIREVLLPIAAPSANRFSELSPTTAAHVRASLGRQVAMVLDGGPTSVGIESTVLSLAGPRPVLLRPGMISRAEIEAVIGPIEAAAPVGDEAHPAPGMHRKHYSPRTPLLLVEHGALPSEGRGAYLWIQTQALTSSSVQMPVDPHEYGAKLYHVLHDLDALAWDWIAVERPPTDGAWAAIRDRLERAASR